MKLRSFVHHHESYMSVDMIDLELERALGPITLLCTPVVYV